MKKVFAFDRVNFILLAVGIAIVLLGMILMSGSGSTEEQFNPAIFDTRRITVAPMVCLFGYLFIVYAIVRRPRGSREPENTGKQPELDANSELPSSDRSTPNI